MEAVSKFLRELRRKEADLFACVDDDVVRKYLNRTGDGCFADTRPSASRRRLPEAAQDVFKLCQQFQSSNAHNLESFRLLQRILHEQCEISDNEEAPVSVKSSQKMDCQNILNPADPDARYNKKRGIGYVVQLMETFEPEDAFGIK